MYGTLPQQQWSCHIKHERKEKTQFSGRIRGGTVRQTGAIAAFEVGRMRWEYYVQPSVQWTTLDGIQLVTYTVETINGIVLRTVLPRNTTTQHHAVLTGFL